MEVRDFSCHQTQMGYEMGYVRCFLSLRLKEARLGKTAREWVLSRYSLDRVVSEEIKRIQSVLGN